MTRHFKIAQNQGNGRGRSKGGLGECHFSPSLSPPHSLPLSRSHTHTLSLSLQGKAPEKGKGFLGDDPRPKMNGMDDAVFGCYFRGDSVLF